MRLIFALAVTLMTALIPIHQISALSPKAATGTIYGKVHHNGKAVRHILVEVMIGDCFSPIFKVLSTNDAGFYRVDGLGVGAKVQVGVNGFSRTAQNKLYQATCGKGVKILSGKLTRHNIALESNESSKQKQCVSNGGTWQFITRGSKGCSYPFSDGGKACSDSSQCLSNACLATSRDKSATLGACAVSTSSKISSCNGIIRNSRWIPKPCH